MTRSAELRALLNRPGPDLLQELVNQGREISCVNVYKGWLEIDTFEDYQRAWAEIRK